jgi:hypothetical protein
MSIDYPYNGHSIRERFHSMIGTHDGPIVFACRIALVCFCVYTTLDPHASYYMSPFMWVAIWVFVHFYL